MKNAGKILVAVAFTGFGFIVKAQDVITLKNGTDINALVQKIGNVEIEYKKNDNPNGPIYTLKKSEILIIRYANGSKDIFSEGEKNESMNKAYEYDCADYILHKRWCGCNKHYSDCNNGTTAEMMIDVSPGLEYYTLKADAYYYDCGEFVKAVEYYRMAALNGYADAQNSLGYMYENGYGVQKSKELAIEWYKKAARQGNQTAIDNLKTHGIYRY